MIRPQADQGVPASGADFEAFRPAGTPNLPFVWPGSVTLLTHRLHLCLLKAASMPQPMATAYTSSDGTGAEATQPAAAAGTAAQDVAAENANAADADAASLPGAATSAAATATPAGVPVPSAPLAPLEPLAPVPMAEAGGDGETAAAAALHRQPLGDIPGAGMPPKTELKARRTELDPLSAQPEK